MHPSCAASLLATRRSHVEHTLMLHEHSRSPCFARDLFSRFVSARLEVAVGVLCSVDSSQKSAGGGGGSAEPLVGLGQMALELGLDSALVEQAGARHGEPDEEADAASGSEDEEFDEEAAAEAEQAEVAMDESEEDVELDMSGEEGGGGSGSDGESEDAPMDDY